METVKPDWPPSGSAARALTIAALVVPILLLPAIIYQRKARDEAAAAEGLYGWSRSLINRPVAFYLAAWACFLILVFILMGILAAFGVSPV